MDEFDPRELEASRSFTVQIRVTPLERHLLDQMAAEEGKSRSEFARQLWGAEWKSLPALTKQRLRAQAERSVDDQPS
jgi:hypothetical protein